MSNRMSSKGYDPRLFLCEGRRWRGVRERGWRNGPRLRLKRGPNGYCSVCFCGAFTHTSLSHRHATRPRVQARAARNKRQVGKMVSIYGFCRLPVPRLAAGSSHRFDLRKALLVRYTPASLRHAILRRARELPGCSIAARIVPGARLRCVGGDVNGHHRRRLPVTALRACEPPAS